MDFTIINKESYMNGAKQAIDQLLSTNQYDTAFNLLVMTLYRLGKEESHEMIKYYNNYILNKYTTSKL